MVVVTPIDERCEVWHYLLPPTSLLLNPGRFRQSGQSLISMPGEHASREYLDEVRATTLRYIFYGFQMTGLLGAVVMLVTAVVWRKSVRRHATWFNFIGTWMISCSSYIFLIGMSSSQQPNHVLCLSQAALIYSVPSLTSGATIALVVHVYITLRCRLTGIDYREAWTVVLVCLPYLPACAMFGFTLRIGLRNPSLVVRPDDSMYCSLGTTLLQRASAIVVAAIMFICLGIEIAIFRTLRRAWSALKRDSRTSASMIVRVLAFTMVGMLSIILSLIFLALPERHGSAFDVVISIIPVSSVFIFGTQMDIFTAWCSMCRRKPHAADTWETFTPLGTRGTEPT